ncbi:MAG: hypothetical protein QOE39_3555 [Bradyrhizobium sp.]|jgi:hypothetical protein|nr:hypothetical protein [Bradyrhizobium sp.]
MIGEHDLDGLAEHAAAGILHRHASGSDRTGTAEIGIKAGLIVEHAYLDDIIRNLRVRGRRSKAYDKAHGRERRNKLQSHDVPPWCVALDPGLGTSRSVSLALSAHKVIHPAPMAGTI